MPAILKDRDTLLTPTQAAKVLNVPKPRVYHLIRTEQLSSWRKEGTKALYLDKAEVEAMARGKVRLVKRVKREGKS